MTTAMGARIMSLTDAVSLQGFEVFVTITLPSERWLIRHKLMRLINSKEIFSHHFPHLRFW